MDALAPGDKAVWDSVMDEVCVVTSEEGRVSSKADFLRDLKPLPPGLAGGITVRDLTVQPLASPRSSGTRPTSGSRSSGSASRRSTG